MPSSVLSSQMKNSQSGCSCEQRSIISDGAILPSPTQTWWMSFGISSPCETPSAGSAPQGYRRAYPLHHLLRRVGVSAFQPLGLDATGVEAVAQPTSSYGRSCLPLPQVATALHDRRACRLIK